jgi:hypothetical protein
MTREALSKLFFLIVLACLILALPYLMLGLNPS